MSDNSQCFNCKTELSERDGKYASTDFEGVVFCSKFCMGVAGNRWHFSATSSDVLAKDYEGLLNAIQAGRKGTAGHSVYCDLWFSVSHIEAMRERFNQYTATSSDASELAKDIQEAIDIIERDGAMGFPRVDMYRILKRCLSALPSTERVSIGREMRGKILDEIGKGRHYAALAHDWDRTQADEIQAALEAANE